MVEKRIFLRCYAHKIIHLILEPTSNKSHTPPLPPEELFAMKDNACPDPVSLTVQSDTNIVDDVSTQIRTPTPVQQDTNQSPTKPIVESEKVTSEPPFREENNFTSVEKDPEESCSTAQEAPGEFHDRADA